MFSWKNGQLLLEHPVYIYMIFYDIQSVKLTTISVPVRMAPSQKWTAVLVVLVLLGAFMVGPACAQGGGGGGGGGGMMGHKKHHGGSNIVEMLAAGIVAKMLSEMHHGGGCHHG